MALITLNINLNKRIETGRPLTHDEVDENWELIEQALLDLANAINIELDDILTEVMPKGSGIIATDGVILPSGKLAGTKFWFICDGQTQNTIVTPDMRNRMVIGSGDEFLTGDTGGLDQVVDHSHTDPTTGGHGLTALENGLHDHDVVSGGQNLYTEPLSGESGGDSFPTQPVGGALKTGTSGTGALHDHPGGGQTSDDGAHDNKPRYFALAWIKYCRQDDE